jgi:anion-transporting  ArsA/GET3 family ATPase
MAQSQLVIFCGKGGVGKTTLSLAYGLRLAQAGRRVLVVTSHPLAELAVAVSLDGLPDELPEAASRFFIVHIEPKELIAELVRRNFTLPLVARTVLQSQLYNNLVEVAPGLKEFFFLGRLEQLAERRAAGGEQPDYDVLLWDAPATGHFLSTLRAAKNFERYLTGPLAAAGAELARFYSNAANATLYPVTTLEEMAIEETHDLCSALRQDFALRPAALLFNLASPLLQAGEQAVEALQAEAPAEESPALRFALDRGLVEIERAAQLKAALGAPAIPVERVRGWRRDLDLLLQLGAALEALPG